MDAEMNQTRHTAIGHVTVDVDGIDQLDAALGRSRERIKSLQDEVNELRDELHKFRAGYRGRLSGISAIKNGTRLTFDVHGERFADIINRRHHDGVDLMNVMIVPWGIE